MLAYLRTWKEQYKSETVNPLMHNVAKMVSRPVEREGRGIFFYSGPRDIWGSRRRITALLFRSVSDGTCFLAYCASVDRPVKAARDGKKI